MLLLAFLPDMGIKIAYRTTIVHHTFYYNVFL